MVLAAARLRLLLLLLAPLLFRGVFSMTHNCVVGDMSVVEGRHNLLFLNANDDDVDVDGFLRPRPRPRPPTNEGRQKPHTESRPT